ncbi:hypothetical protein Pint_23001 [Pistacia integerrima]|uniref:Uncharacterized protein n=1 Tax=Pistacia integerrima TaxID=434235 RepID=A0ACC0YNX6_9ROSI|nr:hypothetical protein Pint_23001 [Pistacia integerrima]
MNERSKERSASTENIDLKKMDEQLSRLFNQAPWKAQKNIDILEEFGGKESAKEEWEIDPRKLIIEEVIGRGAYGSVHRGLYNGQEVAVKIIDWGEEVPRTRDKIAALRIAFKQEVSLWHNLNHPNITKFIGATMGLLTPGKRSCLSCVAEYLPGGTLRSYLIKNRKKKLPFKIVIQLALDLARGLSYLHSKKIVHRDIKAENLLLNKNHALKITDFGVSRFQALNPKDMTGSTGTIGYMAPEVLKSEPYNRKCDVYSFGICLWEICCCNRPYHNINFQFTLAAAIVDQNLRPQIPNSCPEFLAQVMRRCWDADPKKRPEMEGSGFHARNH